jgi:hypothetical protein
MLSLLVEEAFSSIPRSERHRVVIGKRIRSSVHNGCSVCRLLQAALSGYTDSETTPEGLDDEIRILSPISDSYAFSGTTNSDISRVPVLGDASRLIWHDDPGLFMLAVLPVGTRTLGAWLWKGGYVLCEDESACRSHLFKPRAIPRTFHPPTVHHWLDFCKMHHTQLCGQTSQQITGLRVIDLKSLKVVEAPRSAVYCALSYVWGAKSAQDKNLHEMKSNRTALPSLLPKVVQDAMSVTRALGVDYLWVDKYCIDQTSFSKHEQIQKMDSVYRNAELTIISVAGDDQNSGLPGVGDRSRSFQPTLKIGNFRLAATMQNPRMAIEASKWSTRGWTFQEAILSRRRLVFTEEQMYFECNAMHCYESITSSLPLLHVNDMTRLQACVGEGLFGGLGSPSFDYDSVEAHGTLDNLKLYRKLVEKYTSRNLSFDEDSLDAFSGITRAFQHLNYPVLHIWGIPFTIPPAVGVNFEPNSVEKVDHLAHSLAWSHEYTCWDLQHQPRRRPSFPSWSWAGWSGAVHYIETFSLIHKPISFLEDMWFELAPDVLIRYETLTKPDPAINSDLYRPAALHFQAFSLRPNCVTFITNEGGVNWRVGDNPANLHMSLGPKKPEDFVLGLSTGQWTCLLLLRRGSSHVALVVERHGNTVSRVGLLGILCTHHTMFVGEKKLVNDQPDRYRLV